MQMHRVLLSNGQKKQIQQCHIKVVGHSQEIIITIAFYGVSQLGHKTGVPHTTHDILLSSEQRAHLRRKMHPPCTAHDCLPAGRLNGPRNIRFSGKAYATMVFRTDGQSTDRPVIYGKLSEPRAATLPCFVQSAISCHY